MQLTSGSRLGPYDILSPLGAGGFGEVCKRRGIAIRRIVNWDKELFVPRAARLVFSGEILTIPSVRTRRLSRTG
jgi:hypothetical protein